MLSRTVIIPARSTGPSGLGVSRTYMAALSDAGLTALLVTDADLGQALLHQAGALLLPGGIDVEPHRYGQDPHPATRTEPGLDDLELPLALEAVSIGRPTLAICRGVQVLNVALGGTLVQDLPTERPSDVRHGGHQEPGGTRLESSSHQVTTEPGSRLAGMLGTRAAVNSGHHQAVDRIGEGLIATAWAADGVVEAVELAGPTFVVGVQFHPERMDDGTRSAVFTSLAAAVG